MTTLTLPFESAVGKGTAAANDLLGVYKRAPMKLERGEGVELIDSDGARYLDFVSGIGVNALGYGDPGMARTIESALGTGLIHASNLYRTEPGETLAAELVRLSFASKVSFCNSGA
jgi:acetylornithine/N-succinyldiaminopimelate aminotransferase